MATVADLVNDTKRKLYGSLPEQINVTATETAAGSTTVELEMSVEGISPGTLVSAGLNVWFVRGVNAATNTLTVIPGYDGAPSAAVPAGTILYVRPRVTDWHVFSEVNGAIRAMCSPASGLYRTGTFDLEIDPIYQTYAIPPEAAGMIGIAHVKLLAVGSEDVWRRLPDRYYQWQPEEGLIRLLRIVASPSMLTVTYKMPFAQATSLTQDPVADLGLSDSMLDIPPLGAAASILRSTESRRNQLSVQTDPRRSENTPAGANSTAAMMYQREFEDRIDDEMSRLVARVGIYRGI